MKKLICILCLALVVCMCGCSKDKEEPKDDKDKVVEITPNDVYGAPANASEAQVKLYNALTEALKDGEDEEVASLVAQNFVMDFYTLKNKANSDDVGGLTYLPENRRADFTTYASIYAYANYEKIVQEHGKKHLPQVKSVEAVEVAGKMISYTDIITDANGNKQESTDTYNGYVITVNITFAKTKASDLPESVTVTVIDKDGTYYVIGLE